MDGDTFRSRLITLVRKSQKALRLYSHVGRFSGELRDDVRRDSRLNDSRLGASRSAEFTEMQTREWRAVTAEILSQLTTALETTSQRDLSSRVHAVRDRFHEAWRSLEAELHTKQRELLTVAENGDFIRATQLSSELIGLKARMQASQAAHHELHDVVRRSKVAEPIQLGPRSEVASLEEKDVIEDVRKKVGSLKGASFQRKIIPLRKTAPLDF